MSDAKKIPLLLPSLPPAEALIPYLREIDASRRYTNFGPLVQRFEARLISEMNVVEECHAVTACNATAALELSLEAMNLPSDSRILLPATTFVATATAVLRTGHHPLLSDIDADSWLLTPAIAREVRDSTDFDAVLPVAAFGCPQDMEAWDAFQEETGIPVLIDAAGAFGNQSIGARTPVVFSFHATKALGCGEGAVLVAADRELIEDVRQLTNFGISPHGGAVMHAGTNAKLSEYHAAVGLASLDRWPELRRRYRALSDLYEDNLRRWCPQIRLQMRPRAGVYPILPVLLPEHAHAIPTAVRLEKAGIETRRWYCPPLYDHPAFKTCKQCGPLTTVNELGARLLGLPFHLDLTEAEVEFVCSTLAAELAGHASMPDQNSRDVVAITPQDEYPS
jgi:dTDP-4-amino-4,6-dideoxygalactose transaminase